VLGGVQQVGADPPAASVGRDRHPPQFRRPTLDQHAAGADHLAVAHGHDVNGIVVTPVDLERARDALLFAKDPPSQLDRRRALGGAARAAYAHRPQGDGVMAASASAGLDTPLRRSTEAE
jgi:hypothetical protein